MDDKTGKNAIGENESIREGLESFLEKELSDPEGNRKKKQTVAKPAERAESALPKRRVASDLNKTPAKGPKRKKAVSEKQPAPVKRTESKAGFGTGYDSGFEKGYAAGFHRGLDQGMSKTKPGRPPMEYEDPYGDFDDGYEDLPDETFYEGEDGEFYDYEEDYEDYAPRGRSRKRASVGRDRRHEGPARREKDERERKAAQKRIKAERATRQKAEENREKQRLKNEKKARRAGKDGKEKKKHGFVKFVIVLALLLCLLYVLMNKLVGTAYHQMTTEQPEELAKEPMKEEGVTHILLIGNDSRENGEDGRSDAMILVSMNPKTKKLYMTSFLRDMYVTIPGHGENRLNAAYAYGGAPLLCQTIKENFDIEVNRYAIVNFQAFAALVDAVGGVDLELTSEEVEWVNAYLNEYNMLEGRDIETDYLDTSKSGLLHLNGPQALAYSRNRYIGTDFGRTERQRKVLSAIMGKMPVALATNPGGLMEGIFPYMTTNLKQTEVTELSLKAAGASTYETVQLTVPADGTWSNANIGGKAVLQVDFDANKKLLKQEIFGEGTQPVEDTTEQ